MNRGFITISFATTEDAPEVQFTQVVAVPSTVESVIVGLDDLTGSGVGVCPIPEDDLAVDHDCGIALALSNIAPGLSGKVVSKDVLSNGD